MKKITVISGPQELRIPIFLKLINEAEIKWTKTEGFDLGVIENILIVSEPELMLVDCVKVDDINIPFMMQRYYKTIKIVAGKSEPVSIYMPKFIICTEDEFAVPMIFKNDIDLIKV